MFNDMSARAPWRFVMCGSATALAMAWIALGASAVHAQGAAGAATTSDTSSYEFNDSHFHLTNYVQRGTELRAFLGLMGTRVGHVALFGIPLQQQWSEHVDGDKGPTYYLNTDAPLYYYSFTDAYIAMAYRSLTASERTRFD